MLKFLLGLILSVHVFGSGVDVFVECDKFTRAKRSVEMDILKGDILEIQAAVHHQRCSQLMVRDLLKFG